MNRRSFAVALLGACSTVGCLSRPNQAGSGDEATDGTDTDTVADTTETNRTKGTAGDDDSLTGWERSTDCEGERDSMHDSVISVARVKTDIDDAFVPIRFADLPAAEQRILDTVTDVGGYGTCEPSDAFSRFVERVGDHRDRQGGDMHVYLERDGTYYGLYVEVSDQVYAY